MEDFGEGVINEEDELMEVVWKFVNEYVQHNFNEEMIKLKFDRYVLL